jgi:transcriptional regulator with XRE-family HTH domain
MESANAAALLREARLRHGVSQKALAIRAGLPQVAIAEIESGHSPAVQDLEFADFVRQTRRGGDEGLGRSLQHGPLLQPLLNREVDFVVVGSVAGLVYGSAYPTYDLDAAYAKEPENLSRLTSALDDLDISLDARLLDEADAFSFDTRFGSCFSKPPDLDEAGFQ